MSTAGAAPFVLDIGIEHDVCGIGVAVVFIPRTATSGRADVEPLVYGGPISHMQAPYSLVGTDPMPSNAAKAVPGTELTVEGKKLRIVGVDTQREQVTLEPRCQ
ncbi:hypothetical protein ACQEVZ_02415 [Dactylosporangium sp. CA-152071]|uniref:hypothetical protein n=1 Tax=Dactylosporangium sp. CA-152071 TaxID=3239933 RepID=UPI003D8A7578